jgi:membrane-bound ClpP family serine protease
VDYMSLALVLATLGLVLMMAEYFLPTGGILIVAGILVCVGAVGVIAMNTDDIRETVAAMVLLCVGAPIITIAGMKYVGKRYALKAEELSATIGSETDAVSLVGRFGQTVTPLRPAGAVVFDGRRVDAVSEGVFIDVGAWVKCIEETGMKIVVRQVPKAPDLNDMQLDDLK